MKEHSGKKAHIRPRVRSRVNKETTATATNDDIDELIDETQRQLDSLLRTVDVSQSTIPKLPGIQSQPQRVEEILLPKPTGILKAPKYTNPAPAKSDGEQLVPDVSAGGARAKLEPAQPERMEEPAANSNPAVKDLVVERDAALVQPEPMPYNTLNPSRAVEGYVPKSEETSEKHLGKITPKSNLKEVTTPDENAAPLVIEAELEFSVLSKQEYDEIVVGEDERVEQPTDAFRGRFDIFANDEADDDDDIENDPVFAGFSGDDDEELWSDHDETLEETIPPEPRAFIKLWHVLAGWVTPEAVALLKEWHEGDEVEVSPNWVPVVDTSDIAASRCAGLMALLHMHLARCLKDLGHPLDVDRVAKHRLADLLRTFNYSRSTARLDPGLWRAMTCVLLCIVLPSKDESVTNLPPSVIAAGLTIEEYAYLTKSCFRSLDAGA
jgi:hypothetical protein